MSDETENKECSTKFSPFIDTKLLTKELDKKRQELTKRKFSTWKANTFIFNHHTYPCGSDHFIITSKDLREMADWLDKTEEECKPDKASSMEVGIYAQQGNPSQWYLVYRCYRYPSLEDIAAENEKKRKKLAALEKSAEKNKLKQEALKKDLGIK
jgi:hypothetical protein